MLKSKCTQKKVASDAIKIYKITTFVTIFFACMHAFTHLLIYSKIYLIDIFFSCTVLKNIHVIPFNKLNLFLCKFNFLATLLISSTLNKASS